MHRSLEEPEPLFIREDELYRPTASAGGPWSIGFQHGGPPLGLLAWVIERKMLRLRPDFRLTRITTDLLRPVPMRPVSADVQSIRHGRRLEVLAGVLKDGECVVARATALYLQETPTAGQKRRVQGDQRRLPAAAGPTINGLVNVSHRKPGDHPFTRQGLHACVEVRPIDGLTGQGYGRAWMRLPMPIVDQDVPSLTAQLVTLSDFGNGIGQLRVDDHTGMINADATLYLTRTPKSEWIGFDAHASLSETGTGLVTTDVYDVEGFIGHIVQATLLMPLFNERASTTTEETPNGHLTEPSATQQPIHLRNC